MTFGELVEQINEMWYGNERDMRNCPVKVQIGDEIVSLDGISGRRGDIVFCDASAYGDASEVGKEVQ